MASRKRERQSSNREVDAKRSRTRPNNRREERRRAPSDLRGNIDASRSNKPTQTVKVVGFVRPLTVSQTKKYLSAHGELVDFWMDKIKSTCYATFATKQQAIDTRAAVHGAEWPPRNKGKLTTYFVLGTASERGATFGRRRERRPGRSPSPEPVRLEDLFTKTKARPRIFWQTADTERVLRNRLMLQRKHPHLFAKKKTTKPSNSNKDSSTIKQSTSPGTKASGSAPASDKTKSSS